MTRWTVPVAVLAALVLVAAGCGGSKKSAAPSTTETSTATTGATTSSGTNTATTSGGTTTGTTSGGTATATTSTGAAANPYGKVSKHCLAFASASTKLGQALTASTSTSVSASSANLKAYFDQLAAKAPSAIKAAFQTLAAAIAKYAEKVKGLNIKAGQTPSSADIAKLQQAATSISSPEVKAASDKITAWVQAGCH